MKHWKYPRKSLTECRRGKQRFNRIACAILAALLCLLCACGGPASSAAGTNGENTIPSETPGAVTGTAGSGGNLIPLSNGTDRGCYTVGRDGEYQLLCYVDYDLAVETPLCAQPSCAHDSDACTAFWEREKYVLNPQTGDGRAIFFLINDNHTGQSEIWTANPDGSGRRVLVESTLEADDCSPAAEDGSFLYYFYNIYSRSDEQILESRLCLGRVPLQGGESEELFSWEDSSTGVGYEFLGVSGREILVYRFDWGEPLSMEIPEGTPLEDEEAAMESLLEQLKQQTARHSVLLVNIDTGTQRELDVWSSTYGSAGRSLLWENGRLYWCDDKNHGPIHWLDTDGQSGELSVLPERSDDENARYTLNCIAQGRLLVDCYNPARDSTSRCAVSLSEDPAGSAQALTLRYVHASSERPVLIEGQGEAGLLVQYEENADFSTGFYEDGTMKDNFSITMRYGMISYEDFFANRPNYRPVEMVCGFGH